MDYGTRGTLRATDPPLEALSSLRRTFMALGEAEGQYLLPEKGLQPL